VVLAILIGAGITYALAVGTAVESGLQAPKTGTILDVESHKPLEGAYVVVRWRQEVTDPFLIGHGNIVGGGCVHRNIVQTDGDGHYSIPSSRSAFAVEHNFKPNRSVKYYWDLYAYLPKKGTLEVDAPSGPQPMFGEHPGGSSNGAGQTLQPALLARPEGAPELRMDELLAVYSHFICKPDQPFPPAPVAEKLYEEAFGVACTPTPNRGALRLDEFRNLVSPTLPADAAVEVSSIKRRHGQMSKEPLLKEDADRLCVLLGRN
jgi:hypothetical protein